MKLLNFIYENIKIYEEIDFFASLKYFGTDPDPDPLGRGAGQRIRIWIRIRIRTNTDPEHCFFVLTLGQILKCFFFRGVWCREDRVCQVQHALLRHSGRNGRHRDSGTSFIGKAAKPRGFVNDYVVPGTFRWNKVLEGDLRVMN